MVRVKFFGTLRMLLKLKETSVEIENNITIRDLLEKLQSKIDGKFIDKLIDQRGNIIPGTIILVNKKNIFHLNLLDTIVNDNDEVVIFPPGAGG
jgi:molybdopterin synthase sulfur carrier subunit